MTSKFTCFLCFWVDRNIVLQLPMVIRKHVKNDSSLFFSALFYLPRNVQVKTISSHSALSSPHPTCPSKGQIISKRFFLAEDSPKKQTKTSRILVKTNSFVRFLGESSAWQFGFEINWPLTFYWSQDPLWLTEDKVSV